MQDTLHNTAILLEKCQNRQKLHLRGLVCLQRRLADEIDKDRQHKLEHQINILTC